MKPANERAGEVNVGGEGGAAATEAAPSEAVPMEGDGAQPASPTSNVLVHYTGYLVDGTKFDSSVDRGEPISFGLNQVIPGWTEGVGSMKVGGKRVLVIPPKLGYGKRGSPPEIPGDATLVFDVELLAVR